ncbi:MAG TPA: hypothetical protein VHZ51_07215 [Ktedonobacteraceae bacterium]|jgi:hypothetical protein|nr:hypothetical protein [Ktedonobacteraceae bacterium]
MKTRQRSIFREHAVARYAQRQEKIVAPRLISLPLLVALWSLLGLLLIGMILLVVALFPLMWR